MIFSVLRRLVNVANALFKGFIYANIFISLVSVGMLYETLSVFHIKGNRGIYELVFFATLGLYSLHWLININKSANPSERDLWSIKYKVALQILGVISGFLTLYFVWQGLHVHWYILLACSVIPFFYVLSSFSALSFARWVMKGLTKTCLLVLGWILVTIFLPIQISPVPWNLEMVLFIVSKFFFLFALCVLFDYRDRETDRDAQGRNYFLTIGYTGTRKIFVIFSILSFVASLFTAYAAKDGNLLLNLLIPLGILVLLFNKGMKSNSSFFFYVVVDGLMVVGGIIECLGFML